jgi:hypothetical protein
MTDDRRAARALLDQAAAMGLGVGLADFIAASDTATAPTLDTYVDVIAATFSAGTARTYLPYLRLTARKLGRRGLDELTVTDLRRVVNEAGTHARRRRPDSSGRSSPREHRHRPTRAVRPRRRRRPRHHQPGRGLTKPRRTRSRDAPTEIEALAPGLWAAEAITLGDAPDELIDLLTLDERGLVDAARGQPQMTSYRLNRLTLRPGL